MEQLRKLPDYKKHAQHQSSLGEEVNNLIKGIKKARKSRFVFWEDVVGERISKVAVPVKTKNGVLFVKVEDAIWRFELNRRKTELLQKINEKLKKNEVKEIVFI